jgi:biotin carboxyl carrier protein
MNPDDIKQLLDLIQAHDLAEFEFEEGSFKLRVKRGGPPVVAHVAQVAAPVSAPAAAPGPSVSAAAVAPVEDGTELAIVGDQVKKGQVLCIIEAMKLMNEIDSEYDGEIASVYVENGQPVQYGERIFAIRLRH